MKCSHVQRKNRKSRPLRKQEVRLPRDYPWQVLNTLNSVLGQYTEPGGQDRLARIIRARSVDDLTELGNEWSLQSISLLRPAEPLCNVETKLLLAGLVKKYQFDGDVALRKQRAIDIVISGEKVCSEFNTHKYKSCDMTHPVFSNARHFCARVLGDILPAHSELTKAARHGPGASTSTSHGKTNSYYKYADWPYDVTAGCVKHAKLLILSDERWLGALEASYRQRENIPAWCILDRDAFWRSVLNIVPGNKITTVPKDARKDRPIAIEPDMNLMLQLGVDGYVRRRLKRGGVNLDSQIKNQVLAQKGSVDNSDLSPCTIDLSSASDTISLRIAKLLLPTQWYRYLCDLRSPKGVLPDGSTLRYSKLSSMGNGGTFAIESLLFASLVFGVCKHFMGHYPRDIVSVFGDDIIVPETVYKPLCAYLECAGFSVNTEKSFSRPGVKESCGTDWYHGRNVRPVSLKKEPRTIAEVFCDRNRITRWLKQHYYYDACQAVDDLYLKWVPEQFRHCKGPISDEEFDTYWHCEVPPSSPSVHPKTMWKYEFPALTARLKRAAGPDFLFRKLMASLSGENPGSHFREHRLPVKLASQGSVFTVYASSRSIVRGVTRRSVYNWTDCYKNVDSTHP